MAMPSRARPNRKPGYCKTIILLIIINYVLLSINIKFLALILIIIKTLKSILLLILIIIKKLKFILLLLSTSLTFL